MKLFNIVLALILLIACGSSSGPSTKDEFTSKSWSYSYREMSGVSEGQDSVQGTITLYRKPDGLQLVSETGIVAYLWKHEPGDDTVRFSAQVYPPKVVVNMVTEQHGDTLRVVSSNFNAWPAWGYYVLSPQGIDFAWLSTDGVSVTELRIEYR